MKIEKMAEGNDYHQPVLLKEVIENMMIRSAGVYVDCTFGGGGHSRAILERLGENGRLIAFDQDAEAKGNVPEDGRIIFVPHSFRYLQRFLRLHKIMQVDGILADLGVSSHQFDTGERGFSIRYNASLDMRMDQRQSLTAREIVNTYTEDRLHKIFEQYGEVTNAKTLARTIVDIRRTIPLATINDFKTSLGGVVKGNPNKYFAQVFQALRIETNDELGALRELLLQVPATLSTGGRIAVITFHSLEDRIVKNYFKKGRFEEDEPLFDLYNDNHSAGHALQVITKKPIIAGENELKTNPRSRSAKLRVAEKKQE